MRTWAYVDGFNLYYGAIKGTPFKWLDPVELTRRVLPAGHIIERVKYFTVTAGSAEALPTPAPNTSATPALQLSLPGRDLIGTDVELLGKQRKQRKHSIAFDGGKRHLRLEGRYVTPGRLSAHGLS